MHDFYFLDSSVHFKRKKRMREVIKHVEDEVASEHEEAE